MEAFVWDERFVTGIPSVDAQHRHLVDIVNRVGDIAFVLGIVAIYLLFDSGVPGRGMAFFLWITVFNLFAVAVFWSFMADIYSNAERAADLIQKGAR